MHTARHDGHDIHLTCVHLPAVGVTLAFHASVTALIAGTAWLVAKRLSR